ncbi:uncharacterized protein LOC122046400 [Zingiber officinale]|uniref:uncharacterized protein LOC122046400 n=1 Tax=Zingiber officinale TaxID=94328 RepID=UPI001C4D45A5|nr:uncharacterized protein LOC122046400 [Zingiber officinale]XP_042463020.1 uncharacterized protein LOC122046400 [Zingiber officinale]XP_042463021.1 uncharacterized protein LOC122046400 [Zingiber officinale]
MNGFGGRSKQWGGDSSSSSSTPSEPAYSRDGSWRDLGTSMSAISFGLAATAILISMFLVMAIFEHVIKPRASFLRPRSSAPGGASETEQPPPNSKTVSAAAAAVDVPVLMPGHQYPTFIAQPSPLPCRREGIQWPPHDAASHCATFL